MTGKRDLQKHWNRLYAGKETEKLGWYEEVPAETLCLVERSDIKPDAKVLVVGAGASTLIDYLVQYGLRHLVANDISKESLHKLRSRISTDASDDIEWVVDDLTNPVKLVDHRDVALWIDRAVLHFLTNISEQARYFHLLRNCVLPGGHVIFGEFSLEGVTECAGLPVFRFSKEMLQERLGNDFQLMEHFDHTYINPAGDPRQYIYTLFKRQL